jgi:predicted transcriptional regulator
MRHRAMSIVHAQDHAYLDDDLYERLQRMADASGRTQAAIVREALAAYTAGKQRKPRSIGLGRSGTGDVSEGAEELLEGMGEDG